jgi:hypothetical protein
MADPMSDPSPPAPPPAPPPPPPELLSALALFERGDFLAARRAVRELLAGNPSAAVADAARELEARMQIDPWGFRIGLLALALLALVTGTYVF